MTEVLTWLVFWLQLLPIGPIQLEKLYQFKRIYQLGLPDKRPCHTTTLQQRLIIKTD